MIYTRFSSDLQRTESCDDQERKVREGLTRQGVDAGPAEVIRDEAVSGTRENREGYERLRRMIDAGGVALLAVDDQSRLSRSDNVMALIKDLVFRGGRFISVGESIDTARDGWEMLVGVMGLHHAASNRETGRRVHRGQEGRIVDGDGSAGDFPYGYRSEYVDADWQHQRGKPKKRVVVDPDQAEVVRDVFRRFADDRWAISRIVRHLNATKAKVGRRFGKGVWRNDHVRRMLANGKYIGNWTWGKTHTLRDSKGRMKQAPADAGTIRTVQRPALRIIDEGLWGRAQGRLAQLSDRYSIKPGHKPRGFKCHPRDQSPTNLVSGLIYCGVCGARMWTRGCGKKTYLNCPNHGRGKCTMGTGIPIDLAQRRVIEFVKEVLMSWPDWMAGTIDATIQDMDRIQQQAHASMDGERRQLDAVRARIDRLVDALADGTMPRDLIAPKLADLRDQQARLTAALAHDAPVAGVTPPDEATVRRYLEDLPALLGGHVHDAAPLLRELLRRIEAHPVIPRGKKRGYMRLHLRLDGRHILAAAMNKRWPDRLRQRLVTNRPTTRTAMTTTMPHASASTTSRATTCSQPSVACTAATPSRSTARRCW